MRIESDVKLDFSDVLLVPKRSTIKSRNDILLSRTFKFLHAREEWEGIPIISSNMSSVTTLEVAEKMLGHGMLACIPKDRDMDFSHIQHTIPSIGLRPLKAVDHRFKMICLDVPNGYIEGVVEQTRKMREAFPYMVIIVGNVVTAGQTEALLLAGADIVKVGIGSGAACSTRIKTGVGMPQLSAVIECADAAHGLGGHIISDGGCQVPGDVVKAFAAGADFVMLGGMLAGHDENGSSFYGSSSERGNKELGKCIKCGSRYTGEPEAMICYHEWDGLKDYRAAEGWEIELPKRGPIRGTLQDITGGLRSACAYVGAKNLKSLPRCATFIQVNRQANSSMWDNRV